MSVGGEEDLKSAGSACVLGRGKKQRELQRRGEQSHSGEAKMWYDLRA